jgi:two-component sensor histidine kinase
MRELTHRINNEFASAISVVSLAAARSGNREVKVVLTAVTERLHRYAQVHRALHMPEHRTRVDAAAYLRELCLSISQSKLAHEKIRLVFVDRPLSMESSRCWRLGMIVYELITNAARHAFDKGNGEIRVELLPSVSLVECRVLDKRAAALRDCQNAQRLSSPSHRRHEAKPTHTAYSLMPNSEKYALGWTA